jgi:transposase
MRKKAYRGIRVNDVDVVELAKGRGDEAVISGVDIGKFEFRAMLRWAGGEFERPWRVANPGEIPALVERLVVLSSGRSLRVAMEPSGTYGDALRQALHDAGLVVERISPKAAHARPGAAVGGAERHRHRLVVGGRQRDREREERRLVLPALRLRHVSDADPRLVVHDGARALPVGHDRVRRG